MRTKNTSGIKVAVEKPNKESCSPTTGESPKRQYISHNGYSHNVKTTGEKNLTINWGKSTNILMIKLPKHAFHLQASMKWTMTIIFWCKKKPYSKRSILASKHHFPMKETRAPGFNKQIVISRTKTGKIQDGLSFGARNKGSAWAKVGGMLKGDESQLERSNLGQFKQQNKCL